MKNIILQEARANWDSFDDWGSAISLHYAICDFMLDVGVQIPFEWEYSNPFGITDTESYDYVMVEELVGGMEYEVMAKALLQAGEVLHRYEGLLDKAGKSY